MKKKFIMGADVSKLTLDIHCYGQLECMTISNDIKGYKKLLQWIKKQISTDFSSVIVVMEYTGIYTYSFERFLHEHKIDYVKRPALDIKRSAGIKRGKTDKADAMMISRYGWQRREELKPMKPISEVQQQLQQLMTHRDKLVADKASYQSRLKELKGQMSEKLHLKIVESTEYVMQVMEEEINKIKVAIEDLMNGEENIQTNYNLIKSVTGVGFANAIHMLIATENFARFTDARKFACYCGVAPFEYESGSSIRGKTKTSHLANKKIKSLLTMAAISAINHDLELKIKYEEKIKTGKAKMVALNIIRFKLIERIFAVIKRQSPYILSQAA
jgi:transposase